MANTLSPLRYPGGKTKIYDKVKNLIQVNSLGNRTYVEPFAGGFGIGVSLLCEDIVGKAILNDFDPHIYHFWYSVLYHSNELIQKILDTPITIEEREEQKRIYMDYTTDVVSDGFATLFLNRVNYSGVIKGGPIGGLSQSSTYKIDCRFNKTEIIKKIERISLLKDRIELFNCDASELLTQCLKDRIQTSFFNIDPPYVKKGKRLYTNYFNEEDHRNLERTIREHLADTLWIVTYDDCDLIRSIYRNYYKVEYEIQHNVGSSTIGKEIVITNIPENMFVW